MRDFFMPNECEQASRYHLASASNSAFMHAPQHGHPDMQEPPAMPDPQQDEGHRQLQRLIESLSATLALVQQHAQRYAGAQTLIERGDILHAAIVSVEDRLHPRSRLDDLGQLRDAMYIVAGRRNR
jgi:hypothetical protein